MQIYKITNKLNNKIYIGKDESSNASYFGSGKLIRKAIAKYGLSLFTKEVIEEVEDRYLLQEREKFWIEKFNSTDKSIGYNITKGGDGGDTLSNNPNRDKIISKISNTLTGRIFSKEHLGNLKKNHPRLTMEEKNMDKEKWLANIRETHAKRRGKTLEEIVGEEEASRIKDHLKVKRAERADSFNMKVGKFDRQGNLVSIYKSQREAAKVENIRNSDISNCITGRQKTVKGFIWKKL
jgi:group I intron endonuclease